VDVKSVQTNKVINHLFNKALVNSFAIALKSAGRFIGLFVCLIVLSACASQPKTAETINPENEKIRQKDPLQSINRKIYVFNDTLDTYLLKPVAKAYVWILPSFMERGVENFFANLGEVKNTANNILQWKWRKAGNNSGRLLINSSLGVAGLFDVARHMGLAKLDPETFGQTLSYWGLGAGPYLVLPFWGPSTLTELAGTPVNWYTSPVYYVRENDVRLGLYALDILQTRASLLQAEELLSGDEYTFIREAYLQRREYLVKDGVVEDDFGAEDDFDVEENSDAEDDTSLDEEF
jgi:phospholipid-binding lipoprotein MlaA